MFLISFNELYKHWAFLFLESMKIFHGDSQHFFIGGIELTRETEDRVRKLYPNHTMVNYKYDRNHLCRSLNISPETFNRSLQQDCHGETGKTGHIKRWISCSRYKMLRHAMDIYPNEPFYIQIDVDMLVMSISPSAGVPIAV